MYMYIAYHHDHTSLKVCPTFLAIPNANCYKVNLFPFQSKGHLHFTGATLITNSDQLAMNKHSRAVNPK